MRIRPDVARFLKPGWVQVADASADNQPHYYRQADKPSVPRPYPLGAVIRQPQILTVLKETISVYNRVLNSIAGIDTAVIEFEARAYDRNNEAEINFAAVRNLTRSQSLQECPHLDTVQAMTDQADATIRREQPDLSPQDHGTAVHKLLERTIKNDPLSPFQSERSILKGDFEQRYSAAGSIRIDVLEKINVDTVCVYDIKTGKSGISLARAYEIASEVYRAFGLVHSRIIVNEVRPSR